MRSKKITLKKFADRYFFRVEKGKDIVESVNNFAQSRCIRLAYVNGIGAADEITLGIMNVKTKKYETKTLKGKFEIVSAEGNITQKDSEPMLHMHVVVSDEDMKCFGGHLVSARISVTFEGVIEAYEGFIERELDKSTGAYILKL